MKKIIVYLGILLFFMSGTVYVTDDFKSLQQPFLLAGIAILLLVSGNKYSLRFEVWRSLVTGMYVLWILSICVSLIVRMEPSMIITILGLSLILITAVSWLPNALIHANMNYCKMFNALEYAMISVFVFSFVNYEIRIGKYRGVFGNPNSFGGAVVTFGAIACAKLVYDLYKKHFSFLRILIDFILVVLSFLGTLISNSRTSTITMIVAILVAIVLIVRIAGKKSRRAFLAILVFFIVTGAGLVALYSFTDIKSIADPILQKYAYKVSIGNELGGRDVLWGNIISDFKFFGNGESTTNSAHSTYFSMLDKYGALGFIFWTAFVGYGTVRAAIISFSSRNRNPYAYYALFAFLVLALTGITEVMMLKTSMLLAVACIPLLRYDTLSVRTTEDVNSNGNEV